LPLRFYGRVSLANDPTLVNNKSNRLSNCVQLSVTAFVGRDQKRHWRTESAYPRQGATVKTRFASPRSLAAGVTIARSDTISFRPA